MRHVFKSSVDWWVASTLEEATALVEDHYEQTLDELEDELVQLPDEFLLTIVCDEDGDPDDEGDDITKTCGEWAQRKPGFLCTTEF